MRIDDWRRFHDRWHGGGAIGRIKNLDLFYEWAPRLVLVWTALIRLSPADARFFEKTMLALAMSSCPGLHLAAQTGPAGFFCSL